MRKFTILMPWWNFEVCKKKDYVLKTDAATIAHQRPYFRDSFYRLNNNKRRILQSRAQSNGFVKLL